MPTEIVVEGLEQLQGAGDLLAQSRQKFLNKLGKAASDFGMDAVGRAKKDYLSGPRPTHLGVVSDRLRSSITSDVTTDGDNFTVSVGTNVVYGKTWELGFQGTVQVPAHQRVQRKVFGRVVPGGVASIAWVRAHPMKVNAEPRPFLEPAIKDAMPGLDMDVKQALAELPVIGDGNA